MERNRDKLELGFVEKYTFGYKGVDLNEILFQMELEGISKRKIAEKTLARMINFSSATIRE